MHSTSRPSTDNLAARRGLVDRIRAFTSLGRDEPENRHGEDIVLFADSDGEYRHLSDEGVEEDEQDDSAFISHGTGTRAARTQSSAPSNPLFWLCGFVGLGWTIGLYVIYPAPTTVPIFIGAAFVLSTWVGITWFTLLSALLRRKETTRTIWARYSNKYRYGLGLATFLVFWWSIISLSPERGEYTPPTMIGNGDKYFIAVNLYNNEAIMSDFITELTALLFHLGRHDVFVSIYESNSRDGTRAFLTGFDDSLTRLGVDHRILSVEDDPGNQWPYGTSPERISFLAKCRNKAMEPIQSEDESVRIPDWRGYTKVLFLNDIHFRWQDMVKLITTRLDSQSEEEGGGYDLACAMDFGSSGLYDTWVARDICGTPFRASWPYVADKPSQGAIRAERPFEVSACWNGAVAMNAEPFLYPSSHNASPSITEHDSAHHLRRRGWKMVDDPTYPGTRTSPPLATLLQFRTSSIEACDHSECFLLSYDLNRLARAQGRRARIYMNPSVKVAYEKTWFHWTHTVLRRPVVRWWQGVWSHRLGYWLFDWPFEYFGRRRDYCTWSGLDIPTEGGRCPPLPGPGNRHWDE